jgi:uncharacterized membrane protein YtjA (UPF0391 family)
MTMCLACDLSVAECTHFLALLAFPAVAGAGMVFAIPTFEKGVFVMLYWAAVFFVIALVAAVLGFSGIAAGAAGIAKILFFVFLVLGALSLIFGRRVPA